MAAEVGGVVLGAGGAGGLSTASSGNGQGPGGAMGGMVGSGAGGGVNATDAGRDLAPVGSPDAQGTNNKVDVAQASDLGRVGPTSEVGGSTATGGSAGSGGGSGSGGATLGAPSARGGSLGGKGGASSATGGMNKGTGGSPGTGGSGAVIVVEAEDASVQLGGNARVVTCSNCSGGGKVVGIGGGKANFVEFPLKNVPGAGTYLLTISYVNAILWRIVSMDINGVAATGTAGTGSRVLTLAGVEKNSTIQSADILVDLQTGAKSIRFYNPNNGGVDREVNAPEFDKIVLTPARLSGGTQPVTYEVESTDNTIAGAQVRDCSTIPGCSGRYVRWLGDNSANFLDFNKVQVASTGTYMMTIYYANGDPGRIAFLGLRNSAIDRLVPADTNLSGTGVRVIGLSGTGGWYNGISSMTVPITLQAGNNVIRLSNPNPSKSTDEAIRYAPDIDRVVINL